MTQWLNSDHIGLLWGGLVFLTFSYALGRVLHSLKHGFSIRLQLFFTLFSTSMISTTLIGWWAINRVEAKAATLFEANGLSAEVFELFLQDFGAKTSLILALLTLIAAGGAWALGRGLASPIENLATAAEKIGDDGDISALPQPSGRELRRLRQSLVNMHEALEDRRQFESFVADLSHDLKNPVAAIKASVEVLLEGAGEEVEARQLFLTRIDEASTRLNLLLSDFLSLARLEARGIRFDQAPLSPLRSLQSAIKSLESLSSLKGLSIKINPTLDDKAHKLLIHGSHRWLTRAFENLLSNAIKFSPDQGVIGIDWILQENVLYILISDEGPGIPKEISQDLFVRFVSRGQHGRAHLIQREPEGTGLGLAIVKQVIEGHGASVQLFNTADKTHQEQVVNHQSLGFKYMVKGAQFLLSFPLLSSDE